MSSLSAPSRPMAQRIRLESQHYERVFKVLETCDTAESFEQFRHALTQSLARTFRLRTTTFFTGATASLACADPDPIVLGLARPLLPVYQEHWHHYDVFHAPQSITELYRSRVASVSELRIPNGVHQQYVEDYLLVHRLYTSATLYLDLAEGQHALVGLFDSAEGRLEPSDMATLRLLARPLNRIARQFSRSDPDSGTSILSSLPSRAREVARLVGEGLSNGDIARIMSVQEDSVKKYVSRILQRTGCQNRTELAVRVRSERMDASPQA